MSENKENNSTVNVEQDLNDQMIVRREKLDELRARSLDPFQEVKYDISHSTKDVKDNFDELEGQKVSLAGRLMSKRGMGKSSFADIQDSTGKIQLFVNVKNLPEGKYEDFKHLDIGDVIGLNGEVMKTKTGEVSVRVNDYTLLAKCLRPLPDSWSGLSDTETKYRQRYLDLIINKDSKDTFVLRSLIISHIRKILNEKGFLEVETPILNTVPGGANARPFVTHHNTLDIDMYLRIAPELYLKRLIIGGMGRVYEIGRNFRNEGMSHKHNPEFTMMELYQSYADYNDMMNLTEEIIKSLASEVVGKAEYEWDGHVIDLSKDFARLTMLDAVKEYSGVDFNEIADDAAAFAIAKEKNVETQEIWRKGDILNAFFEEFVEDNLIQPTFIYDYPIEVSPLSKQKPEDPAFTERFELFIAGDEYGNAYSELNDPFEQRARFEAQEGRRSAGDDEGMRIDEDYIRALEYALPPTGGLGIGIDRLCMLLTGNDNIRDVLLFPTMRPVGKEKIANSETTTSASLSTSSSTSSSVTEQAVAEPIDLSKVKVEPLFEDFVDFETFSKSDFRVVKVVNCEEVPKSKKLLKFTLNDGSAEDRIILSGIKNNYSTEELIGKTLLAITNLPPRKMMGEESCGMILSAIHEYDGEEKLNLIMLDDNIPAGSKLY
ncbi:lysine--tRNA ligase [Fastidiosipila sanguinis]|uniref:Lysine--tRNA ligase n=1 Tax=Fastidiosipila sanguinis TaxID=236753 RepID=A0A2S0KNB5_9FIRM|nr:lysine--tRNA ligase [Fastidiosipila sanguinis]AVM42489.1 lysine--tRNA ligase [Fastidiosipila sanguinis]